jgi:hypothetical protein
MSARKSRKRGTLSLYLYRLTARPICIKYRAQFSHPSLGPARAYFHGYSRPIFIDIINLFLLIWLACFHGYGRHISIFIDMVGLFQGYGRHISLI